MKRSTIFLLVPLLLLASCSEDNTVKEPVKKQEPTYYVLCDFSASQGRQSLQVIMENADSLFKVMCRQNARIIYMDISAAQFEKPFFDYKLECPSFVTGTRLKELEQEKISQGDTLRRRMQRICQLPSSNNTCIIRTIEKVANSMPRDIGPGKIDQPVKMVILSDLLEDCQNGLRRINIDRADFAPAFERLASMPTPTSTFSDYKNMEITLVAASQRIIKQDSLNRFWKEVFGKFSYDLKGDISVSLPRWAQERKKH